MLRRALYVGPKSATLHWLQRIAHQVVPHAALDIADGLAARPGEQFPWADYDAVFLNHDLGLPNASGLAWLRSIMGECPAARVVLIEDIPHSLVRDIALDLGACGCFATDSSGAESLSAWLATRRDEAGSAPIRSTHGAAGVALTDSGSSIRIPGYRIERLLARGGMAAIYTAQADAGARVALKVLSLRSEAGPEFLSRFMREYATLAQLNHPNVVRIFERGFASDFAYIAMELCPSGDLRLRLQAQGIDPPAALGYVDQIASGLSAAHRIGIVHRDVKPGNILFRDEDTLVVTDFGVARNTARNARITQDHAIIGTPLYVSPEQIEGREPDARSDLYSLGAVLFQLLTGRPPFQSDSRVGLLGLHVSAPIPRLPPELGRFQPLIDGLLAKDPDERFQSADEVSQGLDWVRASTS